LVAPITIDASRQITRITIATIQEVGTGESLRGAGDSEGIGWR
jgi:hypothetical protein